MTSQDTLRADIDDKKGGGGDDQQKEAPMRLTKIINGKNEPAFQLKLTPEYLIFRYLSPVPAFCTFTIVNTKPDKQAFKVKTTDGKLYTAKPSVGFIKSGETVHVRITYLNPAKNVPTEEQRKKHIAVYHVSAGNAKTYKEAFAKKTDGVHHYYCNHFADIQMVVDDDQSTTEAANKDK